MLSKNELRQKLLQLPKEEIVDLLIELMIRVEKSEARLAAYENPHTPSSQQRFKPQTKDNENQEKPRFPGAPVNHKGAGIRLPKPDKIIEHKLDGKNLKLVGKYTRHVIDFVENPLIVTKHIIHQYLTQEGHIIEPETNLPGRIYGPNLKAVLSELKANGLSYEKLSNFIKTLRSDISICPATVLSLVDNVAQNLQQPRNEVQQSIQNSTYTQADETGMRKDGQNGYVWVFCNQNYTLYEFDPTRSRAVAERILGKDYGGCVVSDGYNAYDSYENHQRCWVHILREADALAIKYPNSNTILQVDLLHKIYRSAEEAKNKPLDERLQIIEGLKGLNGVGYVIGSLKSTGGCKKFAGTLHRAMPNLFVGVEHPEIPLHNNFCERKIRPIVIDRKMWGCIRNEKGERFINNTMSMIETWKLQNKNVHKMLVKYAS